MSKQVYDEEGRLQAFGDDITRTFYVYDEQGNQISARPYSVEENAEADALAAQFVDMEAKAAQREKVRLIITDLKAEKDRMDPILAKTPAQITGGDTKDVARAAKRIADAAIDIAKLLTE